MKKTRFCTRLLALILATITLCLCSCDGTSKDTETLNTGDTVETDTNDTEAMFLKIYDDLPDDLSYNGEVINIVIRGDQRYSYEFLADDLSGGVVSNAVFKRNTEVKERLGVEMEFGTVNEAHGPWKAIDVSIQSGACEYDLAIGSSCLASEYALKGSYRNLRNVEYLDFEKGYWSQGMLENMTLAGATYFMTGSISTYFYDSALVIYFNRDVCDAWGITPNSLYEKVLGNAWTLEEMIKVSKDIWDDRNGDGIANDGDVFGFGLQVTSSTDGFYSACNIPLTKIESDGNVEFSIDLDKLGSVVTILSDFLWNNNGVVALCETSDKATSEVYFFEDQFANDELLFVTDWLYSTSTETMRDMKSDYGILPYPMYDVDQEGYVSYAHDQLSVVGIPVTVAENRLPMLGAFIEAMASGGQNTVLPAYYEKALTGQYVRDLQSVQTLDIILRNISVDRMWFLHHRPATWLLRDQIWYKKNDYASQYSSNYSSIDKYLGNMRDAYAKYADR